MQLVIGDEPQIEIRLVPAGGQNAHFLVSKNKGVNWQRIMTIDVGPSGLGVHFNRIKPIEAEAAGVAIDEKLEIVQFTIR